MLRAIILLFCSKYFQIFECDANFLSFQLYLSIKGLIFDIVFGWLLICLWFNATVKAYWKQLHHYFLDILLLFYFWTIQENLYMVRLFSKLFFECGNTINQTMTNQLTSSHWFFQPILIFLQKKNNKFFAILICFITHHNFYIAALGMHSTSFFRIFSIKWINFICIVNCIFHWLWVWRSFAISLKYGLIISSYSLRDKFLFFSPLLPYLM